MSDVKLLIQNLLEAIKELQSLFALVNDDDSGLSKEEANKKQSQDINAQNVPLESSEVTKQNTDNNQSDANAIDDENERTKIEKIETASEGTGELSSGFASPVIVNVNNNYLVENVQSIERNASTVERITFKSGIYIPFIEFIPNKIVLPAIPDIPVPVNQPPTITNLPANISIEENSFSVVLDVNATDAEGETEGSGLKYSLSGVDADLLSIDMNTGYIFFKSSPNYENPHDVGSNNVYNILVTVTDKNGTGLSNVQSLTITVTDIYEGLFSNGSDAVDFSNLTVDQIAAVNKGEDLYNALNGDDIVILTNEEIIPGTTVSYDPLEVFNAGPGNDSITGQGLDDIIDGGDGDDNIVGGAGYDFVSYTSNILWGSVEANIGYTNIGSVGAFIDTFSELEGIIGSDYDDDLSVKFYGDNGYNFSIDAELNFVPSAAGESIIVSSYTLDGHMGNDKLTISAYGGDGNNDDTMNEVPAEAISRLGGNAVVTKNHVIVDDSFIFNDTVLFYAQGGAGGAETLITSNDPFNDLYNGDAGSAVVSSNTITKGTNEITLKALGGEGGLSKLGFAGEGGDAEVSKNNNLEGNTVLLIATGGKGGSTLTNAPITGVGGKALIDQNLNLMGYQSVVLKAYGGASGDGVSITSGGNSTVSNNTFNENALIEIEAYGGNTGIGDEVSSAAQGGSAHIVGNVTNEDENKNIFVKAVGGSGNDSTYGHMGGIAEIDSNELRAVEHIELISQGGYAGDSIYSDNNRGGDAILTWNRLYGAHTSDTLITLTLQGGDAGTAQNWVADQGAGGSLVGEFNLVELGSADDTVKINLIPGLGVSVDNLGILGDAGTVTFAFNEFLGGGGFDTLDFSGSSTLVGFDFNFVDSVFEVQNDPYDDAFNYFSEFERFIGSASLTDTATFFNNLAPTQDPITATFAYNISGNVTIIVDIHPSDLTFSGIEYIEATQSTADVLDISSLTQALNDGFITGLSLVGDIQTGADVSFFLNGDAFNYHVSKFEIIQFGSVPLFDNTQNIVNFNALTTLQQAYINENVGVDIYNALAGNDIVTLPDAPATPILGTTVDWDPNQVFYAGTGDDTVIGGSFNDLIHGGAGSDHLRGGVGNDTLFGNGVDTTAGYAYNIGSYRLFYDYPNIIGVSYVDVNNGTVYKEGVDTLEGITKFQFENQVYQEFVIDYEVGIYERQVYFDIESNGIFIDAGQYLPPDFFNIIGDSTINADYTTNVAVLAGLGNDTIYAYSSVNATFVGAEGDDELYGNSTTIASYAFTPLNYFINFSNISNSGSIESIVNTVRYDEGTDSLYEMSNITFNNYQYKLHIGFEAQEDYQLLMDDADLSSTLTAVNKVGVLMEGLSGDDTLIDSYSLGTPREKLTILVGGEDNDTLRDANVTDEVVAGYHFNINNYLFNPIVDSMEITHIGTNFTYNEGVDTLEGIDRYIFASSMFNDSVLGTQDYADTRIFIDIFNNDALIDITNDAQNMALMLQDGDDNYIDILNNHYNTVVGGEGNDFIEAGDKTTVGYAFNPALYRISLDGASYFIEMINPGTPLYDEGKDTVSSQISKFDFGQYHIESVNTVSNIAEQNNQLIIAASNSPLETQQMQFSVLMGNDENNALSDTGLHNLVIGAGGNDEIVGNNIDTTVAYAFHVGEFSIKEEGASLVIEQMSKRRQYSEGKDTLSQVKNLFFANHLYHTLQTSGSQASASNTLMLLASVDADTMGLSNVALVGNRLDNELTDTAVGGKNNILVGHGGNDVLFGNVTDTTAAYAFHIVNYILSEVDFSNYEIRYIGSNYSQDEGADTLIGINRLNFGSQQFNSVVFNNGTITQDNQVVVLSSPLSSYIENIDGYKGVVLFGNQGNDTLNDSKGYNGILIGLGGNDVLIGNGINTTAGFVNDLTTYSIYSNGMNILIANSSGDLFANTGVDSAESINNYQFGELLYSSFRFDSNFADDDNQIVVSAIGSFSQSITTDLYSNVAIIASRGNDTLSDVTGGANNLLIGREGDDILEGNGISTIAGYSYLPAAYRIENLMGNKYDVVHLLKDAYIYEGFDALNNVPQLNFAGQFYESISNLNVSEDYQLVIGISTGDDITVADFVNVTILGQEGNDMLRDDAFYGPNVLIGAEGNDKLFGSISSMSTIAAYAHNLANFEILNGATLIVNYIGERTFMDEGQDELLDIYNFTFGNTRFGKFESDIMSLASGDILLEASNIILDETTPNNITLFGTDGADIFENNSARGVIFIGGAGNDVMMSQPNLNTIAMYANNIYDYEFSGSLQNLIIKDISNFNHNEGTDALTEIPVFDFNGSRFVASDSDFTHGSMIYIESYENSDNLDNLVIIADNQNISENTLQGGLHRDILIGGIGADALYGNEGDDILVGGKEDDTLNGGIGKDKFVFTPGDGNDIIEDFSEVDDVVDLRHFSSFLDLYDTNLNNIIDASEFIQFANDNIVASVTDTIITLNNGEIGESDTVITINNILPLSADNFIFAGPQYVPSLPPVVLDLSGDNKVDLLSSNDSGVTLDDLFHNGSNLSVGWVGPQDGLLMYDPESTGKYKDINQIRFTEYTPNAKTDLEGLIAFDTNNNGLLDIDDQAYNQFGVWQDKNTNAKTDAGEYNSLRDLGIVSIALTSDNNPHINAGNTVYGIAEYKSADGSAGVAADVGLNISKSTDAIHYGDVIDETTTLIPSTEIASQPAYESASQAVHIDTVCIPAAEVQQAVEIKQIEQPVFG